MADCAYNDTVRHPSVSVEGGGGGEYMVVLDNMPPERSLVGFRTFDVC